MVPISPFSFWNGQPSPLACTEVRAAHQSASKTLSPAIPTTAATSLTHEQRRISSRGPSPPPRVSLRAARACGERHPACRSSRRGLCPCCSHHPHSRRPRARTEASSSHHFVHLDLEAPPVAPSTEHDALRQPSASKVGTDNTTPCDNHPHPRLPAVPRGKGPGGPGSSSPLPWLLADPGMVRDRPPSFDAFFPFWLCAALFPASEGTPLTRH